MAGKRSNPACRWVFLCHLCSVRKKPKDLQLTVWLLYCAQRAMSTLSRQESKIVLNMINCTESGMWGEFYCLKLRNSDGICTNNMKGRAIKEWICCWFSMNTELSIWVRGRPADGAFPTCSLILLKGKGGHWPVGSFFELGNLILTMWQTSWWCCFLPHWNKS